jgi:hypothetical protein
MRLLSVIVAAVAILWAGAPWAQALEGATTVAADGAAGGGGRLPGQQGDVEQSTRAAKDSIRSLDLQTEIPKSAKAAKDSIRSLDLQTEFPKRADPINFRIPIPEELIWVALACAVALILYVLRDSLGDLLSRLRPGDDKNWEAAAVDASEAVQQAEPDTLAAADRLSRDGRFVEAIHLLLLQSLVEIRQRLGEQFADSLTSREILRGVRLPPQGRASFRDIVAAVERTYFGGYPAARDDYTACRRSFETLRVAMHAGAAR